MYRTEIHRQLSPRLRDQVDHLIHRVWSFESRENGDVQVLAQANGGVLDPLDHLSLHVLILDRAGLLVGYGRIAVTQLADSRAEILRELELPTYLNAISSETTIAYISRLVVDPAHRGRGIASMIHQTRIKLANHLGADSIYGWAVGEKPRHALSQFGFAEVLERDGFSTPWYRTDRTTRLVKLDLSTAAKSEIETMRMASSN
jgi:GNAT superfamily N-acetyltransferase